MIELKFGKKSLKILIFNIVNNQTSAFKCKKVSLHKGRIKGRTAAREMLFILKLTYYWFNTKLVRALPYFIAKVFKSYIECYSCIVSYSAFENKLLLLKINYYSAMNTLFLIYLYFSAF